MNSEKIQRLERALRLKLNLYLTAIIGDDPRKTWIGRTDPAGGLTLYRWDNDRAYADAVGVEPDETIHYPRLEDIPDWLKLSISTLRLTDYNVIVPDHGMHIADDHYMIYEAGELYGDN